MRHIKLFENFGTTSFEEIRDNIEGILVDLSDKGYKINISNVSFQSPTHPITKIDVIIDNSDVNTDENGDDLNDDPKDDILFSLGEIKDDVFTMIDYIKSELGDDISIGYNYYYNGYLRYYDEDTDRWINDERKKTHLKEWDDDIKTDTFRISIKKG